MSKTLSENKKEKWRATLLEWQKSGRSMRSFSKTKEFSNSSLSYWRKKIFPEKHSPPSKEIFKELIDIPSSKESSVIEMEYKNITIKIEKGFDRETLANLLFAIRSL